MLLRLKILFRGILFAFIQLFNAFKTQYNKNKPKFLPESTTNYKGIYLYKEGKAGRSETVSVTPGLNFTVDKLIATDTSSRPGKKTKILHMYVGNIIVSGNGVGILSEVFSKDAVGNELAFPMCQSRLTISLEIQFLEDCAWIGELWGASQSDASVKETEDACSFYTEADSIQRHNIDLAK